MGYIIESVNGQITIETDKLGAKEKEAIRNFIREQKNKKQTRSSGIFAFIAGIFASVFSFMR